MSKVMLFSRINANDDSVKVMEWLVNDGDLVEVGALILRVETSKVAMEIDSQFAGRIKRGCSEGDIIAIGDPIAYFDSLTETIAHPFTENLTSIYNSKLQSNSSVPDLTAPTFSSTAKKYIEEHGIPIELFAAQSLVTLDQVLALVNNEKSEVQAPRSTIDNSIPIEVASVTDLSWAKLCELKRLMNAKANTLSSSLTVMFNSENLRNALKIYRWIQNQTLSYFLYIFANLLKKYPNFNSYYEAGKIYAYKNINIGVAIDAGRGLQVVVIQEADKLSVFELHMQLMEHFAKYHDGVLEVQDVSGATVTVTDLSSENIISFQPLLNQKQAIILGIGGDAEQASHPMSFTMTFDHQILSGKEVASFLNEFKTNILNMELVNGITKSS
ncbi:MAG: 2-oxo acid dehydrogenase subunit E2 [Tatlockia sp.]|nr:2-oxo acid dehydrogenase subunit E2 [Tatlockia sp.]